MGIIQRRASKPEKTVGVLATKAITKMYQGEEVVVATLREYQPEKGQRTVYCTLFGNLGRAWFDRLSDYEPDTVDLDEIVFDDEK